MAAASQQFAHFSRRDGTDDVRLKLFYAEPTPDDFSGVISSLTKLLRRRERFSLFVDATLVTKASVKSAYRIIKFMKAERDTFKELSRGTVIVVKSDTVAGVIRFMFNLQPPASPVTTVTCLEDAERWLSRSRRDHPA